MAQPAVLPDSCADCIGRRSGLCHDIGVDDLAALNGIGRCRTVPKGSVIAWAGDEGGPCANILSGVLKLSASTADGREQAVGLLFAGDFMGQPYADANRLNTVALTDATLCTYPRGAFEHLLADHPRLEHALLKRTLQSLADARERQLLLARKSAQERVASFLVTLTRGDGAAAVEVPISRGDIAEYLGLTIETVSRQFTQLKGAGAIDFDKGGRNVRITSADRLHALAGD